LNSEEMQPGLEVSQSHPNLMRRHYPTEYDGAKNEWKAMIDHDMEADKFQHQQLDYMKNYKKKLQGDSNIYSLLNENRLVMSNEV